MMRYLLVPAVLIPGLFAGSAFGDEKTILDELKGIQFNGAVQLWNVYTWDAEDASLQPVDDRWDMYIRRARLGMMGEIREAIDYQIVFAYDVIGKNAYTAASGEIQDRDNGDFRVWDAFFTWAADPDWMNVTMGYFRPQVSRESITSGLMVDTFTKALPNGFIRNHVVDSRPGRETGINLGGLYHPESFGINYNVGVFDADHDEIDGKAGGTHWAPLIAGRLAFSLGDPEMSDYGLGYRVNYFGERNGTTVALNYTHQGETDAFERNNLVGVDLLSNYGDLNLSAEFDWLKRDVGPFSYTDRVYFVRAGYNFHLDNGHVLEPAAMYTKFNGDANSVDFPSDFLEAQQIGLNWYIDKNRFKINFFCSWQDSKIRDRGNFAGVGVQFLF